MTWSTKLQDFHGLSDHSLDGSLVDRSARFSVAGCAGVLAAIHRTLQTREPCRLEYRLPGPSEREERWFEALVTVIVQDGAAVQMLGMCRDVTERLRVNREVRRARAPAGNARASRRAGIDRKRSAEILQRGGRHRRRDSRRRTRARSSNCCLATRSSCCAPASAGKPGLVGIANVSTGRETQAGYTLASGRPVIVEDLASETRFSGASLLQ